MKSLIKRLFLLFIFQVQKVILYGSYFFHSLFVKSKKDTVSSISWVVGVDEIAALNKYISLSLAGSFSVNLGVNRFYDFSYDYALAQSSIFPNLKRYLLPPYLLGRLVHYSDGFFYIYSNRFLLSQFDEGEWEFSFLKQRSRKVVLCYVGSDIRSPKIAMELSKKRGDEVTANYYFLTKPHFLTDRHEATLIKRCKVSEKYADMIFSASIDQVSYFSKPTYPFLYFYPDRLFVKKTDKFNELKQVKVVHAPSSPITKGTQLVRSAIVRLKKEGYQFFYYEIIDCSNDTVLQVLSDAHIVLNEFYGLVPGMFGVEAMAHYSALMTAADETIETDLPSGSNIAWLTTKSYEVYDNLKYLLDNPGEQKSYAERGYQWALEHAALSVSGKKLQKLLDSIGTEKSSS